MRKELLLVCAISGLMATAHATEESKANKEEIQGQCYGVNACKSQSACAGKNECATKNECKGKGWLKKTEKECKELKGKFKKI